METNRVWVLYTKVDIPQLNVIAKNGVYSFKSENAMIHVGDVVYVYSLYLGKIRFKAIVSNIINDSIYLSIKSIYRGKELNSIEGLNNRPIHNLLSEITDKSLVQFIEMNFEQDEIKHQQRLLHQPSNISSGTDSSKMPIGRIVAIICVLMLLIGLVVLILCLFDGLLFAICAFIGLCGMVWKELFK